MTPPPARARSGRHAWRWVVLEAELTDTIGAALHERSAERTARPSGPFRDRRPAERSFPYAVLDAAASRTIFSQPDAVHGSKIRTMLRDAADDLPIRLVPVLPSSRPELGCSSREDPTGEALSAYHSMCRWGGVRYATRSDRRSG